MNPRQSVRTQRCDSKDARRRLADARAQLDLAELSGPASSPQERKAAASCAVLAGIAAADAACCAALGQRSRSQDHRDAANLVAQITPGGSDAARQLQRLLALKDRAHYGLDDVAGQRLATALRQAHGLVGFAEDVLAR